MAKNQNVTTSTESFIGPVLSIAPVTKKTRDVPHVTQEMIVSINAIDSQSGRIRFLKSMGFSTGSIAATLGIKYQFAHNVINRPLKRS